MTGIVLTGMVVWMGEKLVALLNWLATSMAVFVGSSLDVTVLPQVKGLATQSAFVVSSCYVLAIVTAGVVTMFSGSMQARYEVKELVPRLVFGFIASNFAIPLCSALIKVANALTATIVGGNGTTTGDATHMVIEHMEAAMSNPSIALLAVVLGALIVYLIFALVFTFIGRVALLVILAGIAPVAMACYGTPWTQPAAQLWWRTLLGCLGTAILQAIAFSIGIKMIIDPALNLTVLLALPGGDIGNLMLALVVLWMTVKIPSLMRRFVTQGGGTNPARLIIRTIAVTTLTRKLPIGRGA